MSNKFNYRKSLNDIKASLFDIYEDQEELIGIEKNPDKQSKRLNRFIEVKDIALMLIDGIEQLYEDIDSTEYYSKEKIDSKLSQEMEESKLDNLVSNSQEDSIKTEIEENNNNENLEENEEINEEEMDDVEVEEEETEEDDDLDEKKYYLSCKEEDVNFAYVPKEIYENLKNHVEETEEVNEEEEEKDNNLYKQDQENPKGIIVRNDQYMKLALSKHRQENVIAEAKEFRIEAVKRKREENQQKELEKAKVEINL